MTLQSLGFVGDHIEVLKFQVVDVYGTDWDGIVVLVGSC